MASSFTRREFIGTVGAAMILPGLEKPRDQEDSSSPNRFDFRIRTITAGIHLRPGNILDQLQTAVEFLKSARSDYTERGYEVQTIRIATQPIASYLPDWRTEHGLQTIQAIDAMATEHELAFNIGPLIVDDQHDEGLADWVVDMNGGTSRISTTVHVASAAHGIHHETARTAASIIAGLAKHSADGEGNFSFAATAFCPPGTPFFPAAYHNGTDSFAIGLESPRLLETVFQASDGIENAKRNLSHALNSAMQPIAELASKIETQSHRRYLGIDVSPAPGLDSSIGAAIETLTGAPFGSMSTLSACAAITDVLKSVDVQICGYSGLMLPVLEDPILAKRAAEGRYGISELLLYSSVCGTGLDVVPLPGDTSVDTMRKLITDVASLSNKYQKPLSARLFPVPGKRAGEQASFKNPNLTGSMIMSLD